MSFDVKKEVLQAEKRIRGHIRETPLEPSPHLSQLADARVYLKLESSQITGSFKLRGALNKFLSLTAEQRETMPQPWLIPFINSEAKVSSIFLKMFPRLKSRRYNHTGLSLNFLAMIVFKARPWHGKPPSKPIGYSFPLTTIRKLSVVRAPSQ